MHPIHMENTLNFWQEVAHYQDTPREHQRRVERFTANVNATPALKAHRDFVEQHVYGFGERSFLWMWKLLVDEMPENFKFLEIGVFKGQILSLIRLLSASAQIYGITPLSTTSGPKGQFPKFPEGDYRQHIQDLHTHFGQPMPTLIVGESTQPDIIAQAESLAPFDVIYIDGGHEYEVVVSDLLHYARLVRPGGFLVVDDCSNFLRLYWGAFPGIMPVSQAVRDVIEPAREWKHLLAVMHNRIWQRVIV
jgi:SAM-dependent methyltransferase